MSKSSDGRRSWGRGSSGNVTVIDVRAHRASARNARSAFVVTLIVVALLSATVAADRMHPILALLLGLAFGAVTGAITWALVRIWPVVRLLWWWTPEIGLALGLVSGWTALARHTIAPVRLLVVALVVGVPTAVPFIRRRLVAAAWCLIVRHRIRVCFAEFIIANQSGTLPFILLARPTPVGERVWVYLRPGLSPAYLESRLDKIAVACHASTATIDRASEGNSAFVCLNIKRRDALKADVASPLVDVVDPDTPSVIRVVPELPTALDLPDVAEQWARPATTRPDPAARRSAPVTPATQPAIAGASGRDLSDWID